MTIIQLIVHLCTLVYDMVSEQLLQIFIANTQLSVLVERLAHFITVLKEGSKIWPSAKDLNIFYFLHFFESCYRIATHTCEALLENFNSKEKFSFLYNKFYIKLINFKYNLD